MSGLLTALRLADTAFPSGSFAFSQGLEPILAADRAAGAEAVLAFVREQLRLRFATADRVALVRAFRVADDQEALAAVDREFHAASPVEAQRAASLKNGAALLAAHARLGTEGTASYQARVRGRKAFGHLAIVQGMVSRSLGLKEAEAINVAGYGLAMGIAQAALRLGRVGAMDTQRIVGEALADIDHIAALPIPEGAAPSSFTPLVDIAATHHSRQRGRLFAS
ncbi:urease accessory protein UreF [Amorphus coralli]|uniref:urease accessory protein UreF n=1 Tax=Amorphus coralli TaxID=340680 RepID=UPI000375F199|nr:urease accessory UreF family protein [Amorphus coralli]